jgi:hypothetical protein
MKWLIAPFRSHRRGVYTADAMDAQYRSIPFRWILPVAQFVLCVLLLWQFWFGLGRHLWKSIQHPTAAPVVGQSPVLKFDLHPLTPPERRAADLFELPFELRLQIPAALNIPVWYSQFPYALSHRANREWTPRNVNWLPAVLRFPEFWRATTWPFVGIFFWWLAGRGFEAIVAARRRVTTPRIRWMEAAFGLFCLALGIVTCIFFFTEDRQYQPDIVMHAMGGLLWGLLGMVMVAASVIQWRLRTEAKK